MIAELVVGLVLVLGGVFAVATAWNRRVNRRLAASQKIWSVQEHTTQAGDNEVWIECPGEKSVFMGSCKVMDEDFESKIEMIRAEARLKQVALNIRD